MELTFLKKAEERKNFLENNWNKKHLHLTNCVSDLFVLDISQLDELLLDENVESRAVVNKSERKLSYGPFNNSQIESIKKESFTFIIHNLNLIFEELNELEQQFSFLPNWLFDDIMCTYSKKASSLGAHYDPYNVMIIQAEGTRKWELQYNYDETLKENEDIKVIQNFNPEFEIILKPGDVLFIPRGCAHRGSSIEDSLSYSVGFKAIEMNKILQSYFAQQILNNEDSSILDVKQNGNTLNLEILNSFKKSLSNLLEDEEEIKKYLLKQIARNKIYDAEYIKEEIDFDIEYYRIADCKWSYTDHNDKTILCINTIIFEIASNKFDLFLNLLNQRPLELFKIQKVEDSEQIKLLNNLISYGFFEKSES